MKVSRYAEEDCIHLMLLGEIVTSKMEVLISIVEDMRTILRSTDLLRFLLAMTHRNPIRQHLNYNESAALIDAHFKRYKFHTEDDNCCFAVIHRLESFGATSLVKDQGQNCWMYSTTEGIAMKTQQIIDCDTTDEVCNGVDLITVLNYAMDAGRIDSIACIDSDADYPESSNEGDDASGYYYGYFFGSEQALR